MQNKREKVFRKFLLMGAVLIFAFTSTVCAYRLPDTGITKCYDMGAEIPCPAPGERFYGQDGQYQGPQPAYRDNGNGTVTDLNTGLIWEQGNEQTENKTYTWQDAIDHCDTLTLPGCSEWRIPTLAELESIVDYGRYRPTINTDFFPECRSDDYWSGNAGGDAPNAALIVVFYHGGVSFDFKDDTNYVRCVCTGS